MKTLEKISSDKTTSELLEELEGKCQATLVLYSQLKTKNFSSDLIAAMLSDLAESIDDLRMHTDGLPDFIKD